MFEVPSLPQAITAISLPVVVPVTSASNKLPEPAEFSGKALDGVSAFQKPYATRFSLSIIESDWWFCSHSFSARSTFIERTPGVNELHFLQVS